MNNHHKTEKGTKLSIQEMIVVEGKNDAHAIRQALGEVDIVWTEGFGLTEEKLKLISEMAERQGVIICTDPDFVGRQIRDKIRARIPSAKHVFLSRQAATNKKGNDIGIENVSSNDIRRAFKKVLTEDICSGNAQGDAPDSSDVIEMKDLLENRLIGQQGSAAKRHALGKILGIGDNNAKQFLFRINRFRISKEEFKNALETIEGMDD